MFPFCNSLPPFSFLPIPQTPSSRKTAACSSRECAVGICVEGSRVCICTCVRVRRSADDGYYLQSGVYSAQVTYVLGLDGSHTNKGLEIREVRVEPGQLRVEVRELTLFAGRGSSGCRSGCSDAARVNGQGGLAVSSIRRSRGVRRGHWGVWGVT